MCAVGIRLRSIGKWSKTQQFLFKAKGLSQESKNVIAECAEKGKLALQAATPEDSGLTAASWEYEIISEDGRTTIEWYNTNNAGGRFPVAIMLQYGHGTGTGGYVRGIDYINPALKPVFDDIAETIWKVVTS